MAVPGSTRSNAPRLLAMVGSPRKEGNCAALVDEATAAAAAVGAIVDVVHLHDLSIRPCSACNGCRQEVNGQRRCIVADDMQPLYRRLTAMDALLIATPVYWWGPSAQTKLFVDRWYGVPDRPTTFGGKPLAVIVASGAGSSAMAEHVLSPFRSIAAYLGMPWAGELAVPGRPVGQVLSDLSSVTRAQALGRRLAELAR